MGRLTTHHSSCLSPARLPLNSGSGSITRHTIAIMFHFRLRSHNKPSQVKAIHPLKTRGIESLPSTATPEANQQQETVPPVVFRRRRTMSDQEQLTRARASELCTMYELSDDCDTSLKKLAIAKKKMPSLSESLIASQAAVAHAQRCHKENTTKKTYQNQLNQRMALKETPITDSFRFAVPLSSSAGSTKTKRGFKVDVPTSPSETSTHAETPSPLTEDSQSKTGRHYNFDLPNMC